MTRYWFELFPKIAFSDEDDDAGGAKQNRKGFCILSEQADVPSHARITPIKGIPNMSQRGRVVSFAKTHLLFLPTVLRWVKTALSRNGRRELCARAQLPVGTR